MLHTFTFARGIRSMLYFRVGSQQSNGLASWAEGLLSRPSSVQAGGLADAAFSSEDGASEAGTSQSGTVRGEERENGGAAPAPWSAAGAGVAAVSGRCASLLPPARPSKRTRESTSDQPAGESQGLIGGRRGRSANGGWRAHAGLGLAGQL